MPAKARATTTRRAKTSASTTRRAKSSAATAKKRPQITVEDLADFNESINGLVHGDSGVGKTPFAGAAPDAVFLSTEKGSISAKRFGSKAKLIRATSWEKVESGIDYLEENPDGFRWVIVDSITKMQQLLLRYLLERNVADGGKNADIDIPQIQDHQKWQNMFKRMIDRLIDLDINVVFIATSMHKEDAEGDDLVLPDIQGKDYAIAQYVCAQMDFVYCLKTATNKKTDEPEWWLITKSRPPYFAKDRYNAVDALVKKPDFAEIIEAIENSAAAAEPNANVKKRRSKGMVVDDTDPDEIEDDDEDLDDDDLEEGDDDDPDLDDEEDDDDDIEDDESDGDDEEEDDDPPAKATRRKPVATTRRAKPATRKRPADVEPPEDEEDDDEEEEAKPVARRRTPRKPAAKKAAARPTASRRRAGKVEPDEDFDPDDGDDDFDDEED